MTKSDLVLNLFATRGMKMSIGRILLVPIVGLERLDQSVRCLGFIEDEQLVAERRIPVLVHSSSQAEIEEEFP